MPPRHDKPELPFWMYICVVIALAYVAINAIDKWRGYDATQMAWYNISRMLGVHGVQKPAMPVKTSAKSTVVIDAGADPDAQPVGKEGFGMLQSDKKTCWVNAQGGHACINNPD